MNWIGILISLLKVLTVIVSILIVFVVLLQRPKNEGLGAAFGGDTASNIFGAQTTNVLAVLTRWLGGIFLGLCLTIAVLSTRDTKVQGIVTAAIEKSKAEKAEKDKQEAAKKAAEEAAAKVAPTAPAPADVKSAENVIKDALIKKEPTPAVQPKPEPGAAPLPPATPEAAKPTPAAEPAKPAAPEAAKPATPEPAAPEPAKPATPEPAKPAEGEPKPQQ
jgi:preprotein translocase subunit SecG